MSDTEHDHELDRWAQKMTSSKKNLREAFEKERTYRKQLEKRLTEAVEHLRKQAWCRDESGEPFDYLPIEHAQQAINVLNPTQRGGR